MAKLPVTYFEGFMRKQMYWVTETQHVREEKGEWVKTERKELSLLKSPNGF